MYEIDRGYEYDEDDPEAYKFWKSDIMAKARDMEIVPSKHRLAFIEKYGILPKGKGDWLTRMSKATGIKRSILEKIEDKGEAAWRVGHRPGVTQQQWARGRVYAFVMGANSSTGPGKPDNKLAIEAGVRKNPVKFMVDFAELPKIPHPDDEATMILGMTLPVFGGVLAGGIVVLLLLLMLLGRIRNRGYDYDDDDYDDDDFFDDDEDDFFSSFQSKPMPARSTPAARDPPCRCA